LIQHHPAEFFGAILNNEPMGYYPPSTVCVEARRHGVRVVGPSLNRSSREVIVEGGEIVLPFKMINGMTQSAVEAIIKEREKGRFQSFTDFVKRVRLPVNIVRSMALCGAFDELGVSRKQLVWFLTEKQGDGRADADDLGAPLLVEDLPDCVSLAGPDFTLAEKVSFEYDVLGLGVSGHPMEVWRTRLKESGFVDSLQLERIETGQRIKVGGIPVRPHRPPTRSGKTVVFLSLEDEHGLIDVTCFEDVYRRYGKHLFPGDLVPLGMWGQVERRGNKATVNAKTVFPLSYVLKSQPSKRKIR